jgi:hypothetical protein
MVWRGLAAGKRKSLQKTKGLFNRHSRAFGRLQIALCQIIEQAL